MRSAISSKMPAASSGSRQLRANCLPCSVLMVAAAARASGLGHGTGTHDARAFPRRTYGGAAGGRCVTDGGLAGPNMRLLDEVFDPPGPARRAYGRIERLLAPARLAYGGRRKVRSRTSGRSSPACRSVRTAALTAGIIWSPLARIVEARRRALHRADPWPDILARKPVGGADAWPMPASA